MTFIPRDYQIDLSTKASEILKAKKIVVLCFEVRTGKTFISLMTCQKMQYNNVLFVTKKKAIPSIEKDYNTLNPTFKLHVTNFESAHKIDGSFDCVIVDESHSIGAQLI